jgi:S1-C subfamily serine protease/Flp pilus assembly protein TadD
MGLSGAFVALAFGGWCTVHGVLSVVSGRSVRPAVASPALLRPASTPAKTWARATPAFVAERTPPPARRTGTQPPAPPQPSATPLTPQQLFDRTVPAVVRVNVYDGAMQVNSHGSGFFVDPGGLVITNYHVINDANFATVETSDGGTYFVEGVVAESQSADLALLKVAIGGTGTSAPDFMPTLPLAADAPPAVGTKVYAIGHPRGLRNVLSEGLISGHGEGTEGTGLPTLQTTTPMSPGSSGGPLLTPDGSVVGVTTAGLSDSQNLNFAVPVACVHQLLDGFQRAPTKLRKLNSAGVKPIDPEGTKAIDRIPALVKLGKMKEAVELAESLNGKYGQNPYYWSAVGLLHLRLKNYDLAIESYQTCLRLKGDLAPARMGMGAVYLEQKKYPAAVEQFELASKLTPRDPQPYYNAGYAYCRAGQPAKAVPFLKYALNLNPKDAETCLLLAHAYYDLRDYEFARKALEAAVSLRPNDPNCHIKLGLVLAALDRPDDARRELQAALSLRPQHAEAYVVLGKVYQRQDDYPAAAAAWNNAVRFDTSGHWAEQARKGLASLPASYRK